ncbi:hypothetical protein ACET3Z_013156 [Daucus carota]
MAGEFEIAETNYCANLNYEDCSDRFKKWIRFLTQQSLVSTALTADVPIQVQPLFDFYSNAVNSTTLENYKLIGDLPNRRRIVITVDDVNRILGFPRNNFQVEPTSAELTQFFQDIHYQGQIFLPRMSKSKLKAEWDVFFDTLAKVFAPTTRQNFHNISSMLQIFGFSVAYNRRINFGKILLKEIIRKMGSVSQRSIHENDKVECHFPRFLMLFLSDKMNNEDRAMYVDSAVVPILRTCTKIQSRLANQKKHENVPLVVTPYMLEQFNVPLQPVQVPQPLQQQQYQPELQDDQPQEQSPPHNFQPLQLLQDYQSSSQSSHYSPYNPPYNSPQQSPHQSQHQSPPQYNFFPEQQASILPSQSEPTPSPTHTHTIPPPQSTSQPLPADSAINPELQDFRTDLQVAQVLSNLTDTFNIDIADFDCDIGFDFQTPSIEPANTQVHNQADVFVSTTDSSSNTSTDTTQTPVVRKVARKRSGSAILREPAALSHKKQRVAKPETTAAASISSQKDLDTDMVNIQSLDSFSPQNAFIEIGRPTAVSCKESSTQLALTLVEPLSFDSSLRESTDIQNLSYEKLSDHSFFLDQAILGNLQVLLPSQASEGQFVSSQPTVPSQGTMVVYTGTGDGVTNTSEIRQIPSETHAREDSDKSLSVREVSAHTNTDLLQEQLAAMKAEISRLNAENARFRSGELVTLQEKVVDPSYSSLKQELDAHVKGIHSRMDKFVQSQELCLTKLGNLEQTLAQVIHHLKLNPSTAQSTPEDPSTKGEKDKDDKDKDDHSNADAGDRSDKGGERASGKESSEADKRSKGKEPLHQSENVFNTDNYDDYPKDMDDDDVFDATYRQAEEEGKFDESYLFQEEPVDPEHEENVRKFKAENEARKRKLRDYQKLLEDKLITEEQIKIEKQKIYDAAIKQKNLEIKRKEGKGWDIARRIFNGPQRETFDDKKFLSLIYDLREVNPDEDVFMHAFALELEYVTTAVRGLLEEWELIVYTRRNGSFRLSVEFLKSFSVSELWVLRNKVKRCSNLNELLRDKLLDCAVFNSPQVVKNPYCVKFVHLEILCTVYLNEEALPKYPAKRLALASTLLRTKGFASKAKSDADDVISSYCTRRNISQYFRRMKGVTKSQPSDFREDPVDLEVLHQLALARERKKRGESTAAEEPTQNEPSTPIIHYSDAEEGEVTRSE